MDYFKSVSFNDDNFESKVMTNFLEDGLVVITDVLNPNECDMYVDKIINYFEKLGTGVDRNKLSSWIPENLPPQTRPGLFQSLVSNIPAIWDIRSHDNIRKIFEIVYSSLRKREMKDFIVSNDAINVRPNGLDKKYRNNDWPHVDQTMYDDVFKCIQGQAVLTNTTASFVASPKSYKIYDKLIDYYQKQGESNNWLPIKSSDVEYFKNLVTEIGGKWQIPIYSNKGSFIIWSSTTIHSAKLAHIIENNDPKDIWKGWRCVVYVCYRPLEEFNQLELNRRKLVVDDNRTTNHWSTKIFPITSRGNIKRHSVIQELINDPTLIYKITGLMPKLSNKQKKLLGL